MEKRATILFQLENETIRTFVNDAQGDFVTMLIDGEITIVVKEKVKESVTLERVRMLAGSIAREASKQKITTADVSVPQLHEAFQSLTKDDVTVAFVEGWELGTYTFDTYKSKKETTKTQLQLTGGVVASL